MHLEREIEKQAELLRKDCSVEISRPCTVNDGILSLSDEEKNEMIRLANSNESSITFFIPASGVGSRMFQKLNAFLVNGERNDDVRIFIDNIQHFPFYNLIPEDLLQDNSVEGEVELIRYVLTDNGLNYNNIPKGLIPFHRYGLDVRTAFEEQVFQIKELNKIGLTNLDFSVKQGVEVDVKKMLASLCEDLTISFSHQNTNTDAYCFNHENKLVISEGTHLRRPAGHGALIENLNRSQSDFVCVKNIDNVQRIEHRESIDTWKTLIGTLIAFKEGLIQVVNGEMELVEFCSLYQLGSDLTLEELLQRPTRICGMVPNDGAPGGGPFWVEKDQKLRKQIVEKSQIKNVDALADSTHFNPVFMVLSIKNLEGTKFDLTKYVDHDQCMRVEKYHEGQTIIYHELPGLWNGSMHDWNTIFVDVPSAVFSPVKEVMDLLNPQHQP